MKTRTRTEILSRVNTEWGVIWPSLPSFNQKFESSGTLFSTQSTESEGHPWHRLSRTDADVGGDFLTSRVRHFCNSPYLEVNGPTGLFYKYFKGRIFPRVDHSLADVGGFVPLEHSDVSVINAHGSSAIAAVLPTNPVAGVAVTLGELHEGFPRLMGSLLFKRGIKKILQGSADEFLNFEFGVKPLINDLLKWASAYSKADKLWDQFLRDSGKRVRRRYTFPKSIETLSSDVTPGQPAFGVGIEAEPSLWQGGSNAFDLFSEVTLERNRWFSGAFTYFAEMNPSQRKGWKDIRRRLDYLYSTEITPEVIWNLAPWSWAADWLANTGDIIHNVSMFAQDGLVMPYGYMMELSVKKATYRMRDVTPLGYNIPDLTQVLTHTVKYRSRATPYGFGLLEDSFTPRQLAIIASLGLSRL